MNKEEIAKLLLDIKAVSLDAEKGFTYVSGRKGPIYCDNRLILSYPEKRDRIIESFLKVTKDMKFDIVAGVATAGIAWAGVLADRLKKPMVYIRSKAKDHGKENLIEGSIEKGKTVLVIEDLINTGGSSVDACKAVEDAGCNVAACITIFNYNLTDSAKLFTQAKISLYSLSDFNVLVKVALTSKYISDKEKSILLEWQKNPKDWQPKN